MNSTAVILEGPRKLSLADVVLSEPSKDDLIVDIKYSGISTGTEKLFWSGEMPPFPGMGYPLVPGYEAAGEVVQASPSSKVHCSPSLQPPAMRWQVPTKPSLI